MPGPTQFNTTDPGGPPPPAGGGGSSGGGGGAGSGSAGAAPAIALPLPGQVVLSITVTVPAGGGPINAGDYRLAEDETVEIRPFSTNAGNLNIYIGQQGVQLTAAAPLYVLKPADVPQVITMQGRGLWELWVSGTAADKLAVTVRKG